MPQNLQNLRFSFNRSVDSVIKSSGINDAALRFTMSTARELMEEFVPKDTGRLIESASEDVTGDFKGRITYSGPYARRHFYNTGGTDSLGRTFSPAVFNGAPRRGAGWDEAMLNEYESELYARVDRFIRRG